MVPERDSPTIRPCELRRPTRPARPFLEVEDGVNPVHFRAWSPRGVRLVSTDIPIFLETYCYFWEVKVVIHTNVYA
ncbi:hypothetical protein DPMN_169785 [Dreissena polymorpha]|uniref:Uncharacterized protein n=1 Tax=Dreissena polymorpha TaxID=45954 RepID=A0A9D4DY17_DREPO|nr:hypothetical protein DPMN_169785 [Dreissena polymorpha]